MQILKKCVIIGRNQEEQSGRMLQGARKNGRCLQMEQKYQREPLSNILWRGHHTLFDLIVCRLFFCASQWDVYICSFDMYLENVRTAFLDDIKAYMLPNNSTFSCSQPDHHDHACLLKDPLVEYTCAHIKVSVWKWDSQVGVYGHDGIPAPPF